MATQEYALDSILNDYEQTTEQKPNVPRTRHNIESHVKNLDRVASLKLFAPYDGNVLIDHTSDLDSTPDEDDHIQESTISFTDLPFTHNAFFKDFYVYLSDVPNSLERSIAQQVFGDENLYTTIEDEVDRAKSLSYTQSKRDREIIQTISTLYNTPIHIYNTTNTLRDVITPLDSWGKEVKEPILLLQYEKGMYAALTKSKTIKVLLINKIVQQSRQEDTDIEDQIRNSFLQGKSWTAEDERQHQVLIQGPASFDNLQDLQWEIESQESLDMNDSRDSLSQKIQQKNYSPQLSRKSYNQEYQKALEMDNEYQDDSFEEQLAMAIQLSIQDQSRETGNVMGSYKNQSKDQPYKKK